MLFVPGTRSISIDMQAGTVTLEATEFPIRNFKDDAVFFGGGGTFPPVGVWGSVNRIAGEVFIKDESQIQPGFIGICKPAQKLFLNAQERQQ